MDDKNLDEIADVIEVLFAIGSKHGYSSDEVLARRNDKKVARCGFENNLALRKAW